MNTIKSIVLIEDDEKLAKLISQYLIKQNFQVTIEMDGAKAVDTIQKIQPDIVLLDLMLPNVDGFSICRALRADFKGGILFLTASQDDMDHVAGLELGADDYVMKPVHPRVLLARIRLLLRKLDSQHIASSNTSKEEKSLSFGNLEIHAVQRCVSLNKQAIQVTSSEFDVLWLLASHAEQVLSRDHILKVIRGVEYDGLDRSIDVKIASLRKKLGDSNTLPSKIITVRGKGYLFVPDSWT